MAIKSGFFNSVNSDRLYDAEDVNQFFDGVITDGVLETIGDIFLVGPSSGLQLVVESGKAWFLNSWIVNTSDLFLTLDDADITYDRIDIIALDFDKSDLVRENDIVLVTGTPAGVPVPPTLVDTATHLQKPLAHILVVANETVIGVEDITIKVDTVDCPFSEVLTELVVNVDDVTIEVNGNNDLAVKDGGVDDSNIGPRIARVTNRQGGDPNSWWERGITNYVPGYVMIQVGEGLTSSLTVAAGDYETQQYTFPQAFAHPPLVFLTHDALGISGSTCIPTVDLVSTTGFTAGFRNVHTSQSAVILACDWLAIGPG